MKMKYVFFFLFGEFAGFCTEKCLTPAPLYTFQWLQGNRASPAAVRASSGQDSTVVPQID